MIISKQWLKESFNGQIPQIDVTLDENFTVK